MKKSLLVIVLFSSLLQAQNHTNQNYKQLWKEVENFDAQDLPKSAVKIVDKIYEKAKREGNDAQLIKSLFYQSKYALILEEDAQLKVIHNFENEITKAKFPTKNILESILANLYWQYFQQNRWRFYNRTETAKKVDATDFRTWDLQTIFKEIQLHFDNSLQDAEKAQEISLNKYDEILHTAKDSKKYRPTLYDFLAHNALDFYKTDETNLTKPAYKFEIDNEKYLAIEKYFADFKIVTKDTFSLQQHALEIYQNLIHLHRAKRNINALVVVDIERMNFVRQHAKFTGKDALYIKTLEAVKSEYKEYPVSTLYDYEIVQYYHQQGQKYQPKKSDDYKWDIKKAKEVCEAAINSYPKSLGAEKCKALLGTIKKSSMQLMAEEFLPTDKESRVLLHHKNMHQLFFKVLKIKDAQIKKLHNNYNNEAILALINELPVVNKWQAKIRNEGDYQRHSSELVIPKLSQGKYMIFAADKENTIQTYAYALIQVTDIALVESNTPKQQIFQVVDRNTGAPLIEAKIHLSNKEAGRYTSKIDKTFTTDKYGQIYLPVNEYYSNVKAEVRYKDRYGEFGDYYLRKSYRDNGKQRDYNQAFLFTDRSIYRPGQTLYFKAIAVKRKPRGKQTFSEVISDENITVELHDVNGQKVKTLDLMTNEFGSIAGEFILPDGGLTGRYYIQLRGKKNDIYSSINIAVEEYKRPKFETKFKPVEESFKINDSVEVTGIATAFAGNAITEAKVVYRVHRKVQYPRWWYWYRSSFSSEPQEITHGETTTDAKGEYQITFIAQPDKSVDKTGLPIFNYEITADVTDINGETHTTKTLVKVGYHSITAHLDTSDKWNRDDEVQKIKLITQNLNGQDVSVEGILKIYKLKAPDAVLRPRPWEVPDFKTLSKGEFKRKFPHEAYDYEDDVRKWELGEMVYNQAFTTKEKDANELTLKRKTFYKKWEIGKYQIILETQDKFGQKVTDKQIVELYDLEAEKVADKQLISIKTDQTAYKIGESVCMQVGSASKDVYVLVMVEKDKKIVRKQLVHLNNEIKYIEIPVKKEDLGGFAIHYQLVNYNAFSQGVTYIKVPLEQKELSIETVTFRDKIQPGSEQTWSFKLKGLQKDKAAAEFLASMYDASLDQFKAHKWSVPSQIGARPYYSNINTNAGHSFGTRNFTVRRLQNDYISYPSNLSFDRLNWFGFRFGNYYGGDMMYDKIVLEESVVMAKGAPKLKRALKGKVAGVAVAPEAKASGIQMESDAISPVDVKTDMDDDLGGDVENLQDDNPDFSGVQARTNFNETAFFYPQLQTDKEGNISFTFTIPEALTKWKLQLLGHTKDLQTAYTSLSAVTQKDLMVTPNAPRFLREGDTIILSAKISNLTDSELAGNAKLVLQDAVTNKEIQSLIQSQDAVIPFKVKANGNKAVSWELAIPKDLQAVQYKVVTKAGNFSDGEQNILPVLTNRMLVTETMPMWVNSHSSKTFTLDKLKNTSSTSLTHQKLTLEVTSNPVWYAVQALPYLMEYPYECAEQTFSRYYANAIATQIVNSNPRIKQVFDQWKNTDALLSNLEKNQELKALLIQETPWLRDAQSETEQKKRIAILFDLNKMTNELQKAERKLAKMQMSDGGFPWFKGSRYPNRYITQYIATGFGHLKKLEVQPVNRNETQHIITKALQYLDAEIQDDYQKLLKQARIIKERASNKTKGEKEAKEYMASNHLGNLQLQYLYMHSFYKNIKISKKLQEVITYYTNQSYKYWQDYSLYQKGLIALVAHRNTKSSVANAIIRSLDENSITSEELGMYWKSNTAGWYWYQAPIETQALMIETFAEIGNVIQSKAKNLTTIDNLKKWLLKNKQTNRWQTTKATTEAVYALLAYGTEWQDNTDLVEVQIGNEKINPMQLEDSKLEAGTGYFKTSWSRGEIKSKQATVTLTKKSEGVAWGALYWQYFEDLDKITWAKTPLQITKKLFLKTNEDTGEKITEITADTKLKVGDLVRVRIELKVDRAMDFVHMKDMRASGFEPVNVLSQYKYQDGLGYYESTKDAATNFFFDHLRKGVYVFEYDLRANNAGDFSNGITTIQCMYAPEFTSHSEGIRVKIEK